ncbi:cytochrome P450 [Ophiobolus disseminans]|uniref:Cytochrome P450 n=1 Tax=Ophiobolus disseminans TaxID=1469910 RepID=A0A6A6ZDC1_9PLEO|nr:cytochrome P450 [Ophiobolus disseminans]
MAGMRIYIVTSPNHVASCYRNTTTISYHPVIEDMYRWIQFSDGGMKKVFVVDPSAAHNADLPKPVAAAFMLNNYHRAQLLPGEDFEELLHNRLTPSMERTFDFDSTPNHPAVLARSKDSISISVLELCNELFVRCTAEATLGKSIFRVNPNLLNAFGRWERTNWKFMFQMPKFMSRDMIAGKDEIINTFVEYFRLPYEERSDCNYFVRASEKLAKDVGLCELDTAKIFLLHIWAVLGNVYKVAFWAIAYIAYDPQLLAEIRVEVLAAFKDGKVDEIYLAEHCPKLDSFISEVLRLTVASALAREIVAPTAIGDKVLQPGSKLLIPYRQLHMNRDVWGADPMLLEPFRFANNTKLLNSKSYRPFGGGPTLCPGRFVAKRSIGFAVALLVGRYDISVDADRMRNGGKKTHGDLPLFPRLDTTKPSPGASLPHEGDGVVLVLRKRL